RLRLSNRTRKRVGCAAGTEVFPSPQALAYRVGTDCAVDRLLLASRIADAAAISAWKAPRLPISGGALIGRGLPEGPIVARTLRGLGTSTAAGWFGELFVAGTMRGLFSLLFGASMLLFLAKAERGSATRAEANVLMLRRFFWLFMFGVVDMTLLLWPGDILS